ncbi:hypothetical protein [Kingella sp. (in: b-proteobacteria)]|nr:hypothetical protein [Kingella sp. (in: b-proteobacteria)]
MAAARSSLIGAGDRGKGTACQQAVGRGDGFRLPNIAPAVRQPEN